MPKLEYRKISTEDSSWIDEFIKGEWGAGIVVVHETIFIPCQLEGFIAESDGRITGLVTYQINNKTCEIVTLDSVVENLGVGTHLVNLVIEKAKASGCKDVKLITTNDNIRAISFYQKCGFQLIKVYPNAVEKSRKLKPEIPLKADNGIPIRDELEFYFEIL